MAQATEQLLRDLYSRDVRRRIRAARHFTVFADGGAVPKRWRADWSTCEGWRDPALGCSWPEAKRQATAPARWPKHAFGTANAPLLVLLHRPGGQEDEAGGAEWIEPRSPTLGGISHAHVERYAPNYLPQSKTWNPLLRYLRSGLAAFGFQHPLAGVMVACLIDGPSRQRVKGFPQEYQAALSEDCRLHRICRLIQPQLVIACGGHVHDELDRAEWVPPNAAPVFRVEHPSYQGWSSGGPAVEALLCDWAASGSIEDAPTLNARNAARVASRSSARSR